MKKLLMRFKKPMARVLKGTSPLAHALNLPRTRLFRLLGILAALLAFAVAVLAASGTGLQSLYNNWHLGRAHSVLLYLPPDTTPAALSPLTTTLPTVAGIEAIRLIPPAELLATLGPVLPTNASSTLPLPQVAEITLASSADREAVLAALQQTFPLGEIDDQQALLSQVETSVRTLQYGVGAAVLLLGVILTLFMTLTVRAGLLAQAGVVKLLIQLGATDSTLARTLTLQAVHPVALGTAVGTLAAALALGLATLFSSTLTLTFTVWMVLLLAPLVLPVLAAITAHLVALKLLHGTESPL